MLYTVSNERCGGDLKAMLSMSVGLNHVRISWAHETLDVTLMSKVIP